jgi:hypothetical protein
VASFGAPRGPPRRGCVVDGATPPGAVVPGAVVVVDVVVLSGDGVGDVPVDEGKVDEGEVEGETVEEGAVEEEEGVDADGAGADCVVVADGAGVVACCANVGIIKTESAAKPTTHAIRHRPKRRDTGGIRVRLLNRIISH